MGYEPWVCAHQGGGRLAPGNTLGAFRQAHARFSGVWMELDCRFSSDGELVVIHDDTVDRTTDHSGRVVDFTTSELAAMDASKGWPDWGFEPIVTLREFFDEGRDAGWRIVVEIKNIPGHPDFDPNGTTFGDALLEIVEQTSFPLERMVAICFWAPTLDRVKERLTGVPVGFLSSHRLPGGREGLLLAGNVANCVANGYDIAAVNVHTPDLHAEGVAAAREHGLEVHTWTPNEPDEIARAIDARVGCLASDRPDLVYEALGRAEA